MSKQLRCYTCLQLDRELKPLKAHARCLFSMLCPEMFTRAKDTAEYLVCWECEYMGDKVKRFQDKLKKANQTLKLSLKGKITIIEGLSTQKITTVEIISIPSRMQGLPQEGPCISENLPILPQNTPILPQKPSFQPPKPSIIINPQNVLTLSLKDLLDASKCHTQTTIKIEPDDESTRSNDESFDEGSCSNDFEKLIQPTTIQQMTCDPLLALEPRENQSSKWLEIEVPLITPIKNEVASPETSHSVVAKEHSLRGSREPVKVTVKKPIIKAKDSKNGEPTQDLKKNDLLIKLLAKPPKSEEQFVLRKFPHTSKVPECSKLGAGVNDCECCTKDEAKLIILDDKELKAYREKRKQNPIFLSSQYKCESCIEWFVRPEKFDEHKMKHDASRGKSICGICEQRFSDVNDLNDHHKQHFIVYQCLKCPYRNNDRYKLSAHCRLNHEESAFTCKKCFEVFKTVRDRRIHTSKVHSQELPCKECTKTFANSYRLKLHIQNVHRSVLVKCHICKRKIKPYYLKSHIKNHSAQGAKEYCVECGIFFKTKYSYRLHLTNTLKHNSLEKLGFKCDHCDKYFGCKQSLKTHIDEIGGVKYTCDICKKDSKTKKCLARHIAQVHYKIMPKTKPKICEFCGRSFTIRKSLVEHINSHLGIRPHVCKDCGATFVYSAALFTHRRLVHKVKKKSEMTPEK